MDITREEYIKWLKSKGFTLSDYVLDEAYELDDIAVCPWDGTCYLYLSKKYPPIKKEFTDRATSMVFIHWMTGYKIIERTRNPIKTPTP